MKCVRKLSDGISGLPAHVYERVAEGARKATDIPEYSILHDAPNPSMTAYEWHEVTMGDLTLEGNSLHEIVRNGRGNVTALWPLRPRRMEYAHDGKGGLLYYYKAGDGSTRTKIPAESVLHIKGFSRDGLVGLSPIAWYRETVGVNSAANEFTGRFFSNGANASKVLVHPGALGDEAHERLRRGLEAKTGLANSHNLMILEEGMKLESVGIPPRDSQLLELLQLTEVQIAGIFGLPPHTVGIQTKTASYGSLEQENLSLVIHSFRSWLVRIEQAVNVALFAGRPYYLEHAVDALLRGDAESRFKAYSTGIQHGILSPDEARALENRNPREDGEGGKFWRPLNFEAVGSGGERSIHGRRVTRELKPVTLRETRKSREVSFKPVFADAADRVVRREVADVRKIVRKYAGTRDRASDLLAALEDWYEDHHREYVGRAMTAPSKSLASAVLADIQADFEDDLNTEAFREFVASYVDTYSVRHIGSSLGQLRKLIEENPEADLNVVVGERLDEWSDKRPAKVARNETARLGQSAARVLFGIGGVTRFRWDATGENCPICDEMNGREVGVDVPFAAAGEGISDLTARSNVFHPPIHAGCDCSVVPA
jgi:HK97 family phage portal protein